MSPDETHLFDHLSSLIMPHVSPNGTQETAIPGVRLSSRDRPTVPEFYFAKPAVYFVAQGLKQVTAAGQTLVYGRSNFLVASIDMPVSGSVIEASPEQPCVGIHLALEPRELGALLLEASKTPARPSPEGPALYVGRVSPPLLDALVRLAGLLDAPDDVAVMAPLIIREIFFRLLQSDSGEYLANIALGDGRVRRIAGAIKWLKDNFAEPLHIENLAREVNMSQSSLHHQFKTVTGMSPMQYQKALRLQEARRQLISDLADVTRTGQAVGYESSSQFIREYSRQFGAPPLRDANRLKEELRGQAFLPDA